ncbi:MAG: M48 family metalloprotease [Bryobacteraceae bacterium]|nr:M48 family metalloprotease [Bryobacteraceae bacterium]
MKNRFLACILTLACAGLAAAQSKKFKPGMNFYSIEQDIQLGREAAAEFEKKLAIVNNQELLSYIRGIGDRLTASPAAGKFPYTWRIVNDKSINAFALPGGPMFVNTGLLLNADNEAQVAGVLAHEISHIVLRHGTNQMSKQQLLGGLGAGAGIFLGNSGSILGQLGQLGIGLGLQSVLLKYSRGAEKDSDLLGSQIMNDAGYNPVEMARFFEKLQSESGKRSGIEEWFSSHPNPGNRVRDVEREVTTLPRRTYSAGNPATLARAKQVAGGIPAAPKPAVPGQGTTLPAPATLRPSAQLRNHQAPSFSIDYPSNWDALGDAQRPDVIFAAKGGVVQDQQGPNVAYGTLVGFQPNKPGDLAPLTQELMDGFVRTVPGAKVTANPRPISVQGQNAMLTQMSAHSAFPNETEQIVVVTIPHGGGLYYFAFVAPQSEYRAAEPVFQQMLRSLRFR